MGSQTVPAELREALAVALTKLVDEYGSEWEVARRIDVSQSTVNRAMARRSAGPVLLANTLAFLKMTPREFVAKYAPNEAAEIRLDLSDEVRGVAKGRQWLPATVLQLEIAFRQYPLMSAEDIEDMGTQYEASNRRLARGFAKRA